MTPEAGIPHGGVPEEANGPDSRDAPPRLVVNGPVMAEIRRELREAHPREGCGVLLGEVAGAQRVVRSVRPVANRWSGREDRYLVDPGTLRRLMDEEAAGGPAILGFYHSHPGAPPRPSSTDREMAWPWYLYLIVRTDQDGTGEARAWELDGADGEFVERELRVMDPGSRTPG